MSTVQLPQSVPYQPVRMSVSRYHELTQAGAFTEHDSVELLDGVVTEKMSKNPPHRLATRRCDLLLSQILPVGWHVQNQEPITLQNSEPEPDIAVIRGQLSDYAIRHPGLNEIALVVEVADTTLVTDRFKAQLYAQADIPIYWLVNLQERCIEVLEAPQVDNGIRRYTKSHSYLSVEELPVVIDGNLLARLRVADLLP